jgi:hypothetical protein
MTTGFLGGSTYAQPKDEHLESGAAHGRGTKPMVIEG